MENDYGTLEDALAKWDRGDAVWSIEMGGLGPGYEQVIQIGIFELAKRLKDDKIPDEDTDAFGKHLNARLHALIKEQPPLEGMSGAQAGAIKSVAYGFVKRGYNAVLHEVPKDRLIQCSRKFPAMA